MSGKVEHEVQVRWQDLDGLGHVNHAVVLTYLEEGRDVFLREHGIPRDEYVVGRCSISFNGEIGPSQQSVRVSCGVREVGRKSVRTAERIVDASGEPVVEAEFDLVLWDPRGHSSRLITDAERASLTPTEAVPQ